MEEELNEMDTEAMNIEEMQRYLNQQTREGKSELEAHRNLMEVLGLEYVTGTKA